MFAERTLTNEAYLELARSHLLARTPMLVIGAAFALVGTILCIRTGDEILCLITALGALISIGRLLTTPGPVELALLGVQDVAKVWAIERRSALGSFAFAACLGGLGARTFFVGGESTHMLVVGLVFGYATGTLMRGFSRPWISVPSLFLAATPVVVAAFWKWDAVYSALGLLMILMMLGSLERLEHIYNDFVDQITLRQKSMVLARKDELTGLYNRLALRERLGDVFRRAEHGELIAVHCLDLDRFKSVNDCFGHAVGDALLTVVAQRLTGVLRLGDFVARVGGDEFVVVQADVTCEEDARTLAQRIILAVSAPYAINGHEISIGVSVGIAVASSAVPDLDRLVREADAALYQSKRQGAEVVVHHGDLAPSSA